MADALKDLPQASHPDLLVGFNKADDAGVFRISDQLALVQTVDFFPPIVDDPYMFGQIAAANALSDIYAMGGRPITALNIVGFPMGMPQEVLTEILRGGNDKVTEAGAVVVGGHSIKDKELKFGVAATGLIDPSRIITNSGAQVGDRLFLTKPLGTGIITTGIKRDKASPEVTALVMAQMAALNRTASELMLKYTAHAATDVTGYGLMGHGFEMASGSGVSIMFYADALPVFPEALELADAGMIPGGASDNREFVTPHIRFVATLPASLEHLLFDPQTSGGLLIAIAPDRAEAFGAELAAEGLPSRIIGEVVSLATHHLIVA